MAQRGMLNVIKFASLYIHSVAEDQKCNEMTVGLRSSASVVLVAFIEFRRNDNNYNNDCLSVCQINDTKENKEDCDVKMSRMWRYEAFN